MEGKLARSAYGVEMNRHDLYTSGGWHDWAWDDNKTRQRWKLYNGQGQIVVAPIGQTKWKGHGPNIAANSNCLTCHKVLFAESSATLESRMGPVEAFLAPRMNVEQKPKQTNPELADSNKRFVARFDESQFERRLQVVAKGNRADKGHRLATVKPMPATEPPSKHPNVVAANSPEVINAVAADPNNWAMAAWDAARNGVRQCLHSIASCTILLVK